MTQHTFGGVSWRDDPDIRQSIFAVFPLVRQLQEMLWYLADASNRPETAPIKGDLDRAYRGTEALAAAPADDIRSLDLDAHRDAVSALLRQASELVRAATRTSPEVRQVQPGSDFMGAQLAGQDLRGANLRGTWLIAADLRSTDLSNADVLGADFRDAELGGANLEDALFLTQFQVNAARGDDATVLPASVTRPTHWRR
ncbi:pentapeptide repeat-containing protein [Mycetocola miduiensis]|uniref:Pentapeptide repeat-containing protein n=1 Tax=Mycetocola miduiensis TaxID=995034 RepID=A0A1I4YKT7_9MICO|nr:Pentapeptide repeat-containing protein [Mycetocola miduiensis]